MGVFNTFGENEIQIKLGDCELKHYNIGDEVDIPDGIYVGWEGIVVIHEGKFLKDYACVFSKWGDPIISKNIISNINSIKGG